MPQGVRLLTLPFKISFLERRGVQGGKPCESLPCAEGSGAVFRRILSGLAREELRFDQLPVGGMYLKRRKCQAVKGLRVEIFTCPQTKVKILPDP